MSNTFAANSPADLERLAARCAERHALVVTWPAELRSAQWVSDTLLALVERIARDKPVLLIDTLPDSPLAGRLGLRDLDEGIADVLQFGASVKHVLKRLTDFRGSYVPPGLAAEFETQLADARWRRVLGEAHDLGEVAFIVADPAAHGLDHIAARTGAVVAIQDAPRPAVAASLLAALVTAPEARPLERKPPPPIRETPEQDFESIRLPRDAARESLIAEMRARQRAALMSPPPELTASSETSSSLHSADATVLPRAPLARSRPVAPITEPTFSSAPSRTRVKSRRLLVWALSFAVLAAFAAGSWLVVRTNVELAEPPSAPTPAPAAAPPSAVVALPYSVAVEAHPLLPTAAERVRSLVSEAPNIWFYIAPMLVDSVLYYRVMAGPVADSTAAVQLMRQLLELGHKTGTTPSDVVRTPLAFMVGEYESRRDAEARAAEAAEQSIPAYVIEVPPSSWRVYVGAYATRAEADFMRQLLVSAGLPDSLVERVGPRQ